MRDRLFISIICGVLLLLIALTIAWPEQLLSEYENRYLEQFPEFHISRFLSGEYQAQLELALIDQLVFSEENKRGYALIKQQMTALSANLLGPLTVTQPADFSAQYIALGDNSYCIKESGHFIKFIYEANKGEQLIAQRIAKLNQVAAEIPDVALYCYYVETNRDVDFANYQLPHHFVTLLNNTLSERFQQKAFLIDSLKTFQQSFFKTDHHWQAFGQARGYRDLVALLFNNQTEPLALQIKRAPGVAFSGSRARQIGYYDAVEPFDVLAVSLPEHRVFVSGQETPHGARQAYLAGAVDGRSSINHYGVCYGADRALVHYDYDAPQRDNLLILADSYSNPLNSLIAAHFNQTYVIDLRHYEREFGEAFVLRRFIDEYAIDRFLYMGSYSMFTLDVFDIKVSD